MNFKRKIKINDRFIIPIFIASFIIIIILLFAYGNIISKNVKYKKFAKENVQVFENNKEQVFKVEKILICSSANAIDLSEKQNLQDMSIYQYTDIAVYINNGEELTNKNTIKRLYIDNISLEGTSDIGQKSLNYKNILKFGLKKDTKTKSVKSNNDNDSTLNVFEGLLNNQTSSSNTSQSIDVGSINTDDDGMISLTNTENETNTNNTAVANASNNDAQQSTENSNGEQQENQDENIQGSDKIEFNIVYTNEENEKANYDEPTFYTDCSNPITLEYLNNNIVSHYKMDENKSVAFDGSILKEAGIETESLSCKVKFKINIVNNDNEKYSCWINFAIPLDDIYEGTTMKAKTTTSQKYVFFRE